MKTREEVKMFGLSFPDTYPDTPFHDPNWLLIRLKDSHRAFMLIYEMGGFVRINVKVDPEQRFFWRNAYSSVQPAYHQNKEHWNTIILDGTIPDRDVRLMVEESYALVTDSPAKRIYEAVKRIPAGRAATYGTIARLAGEPKMARAVGNAVHKCKDPEVPCHRVVNAKGELSGAFAFTNGKSQAELLSEEGVETTGGRVDLSICGWEGEDE